MVQIGQPQPPGLGEACLAVPVLWEVAQPLLMPILHPADVTVDSMVAVSVENPYSWCDCRGPIESKR